MPGRREGEALSLSLFLLSFPIGKAASEQRTQLTSHPFWETVELASRSGCTENW